MRVYRSKIINHQALCYRGFIGQEFFLSKFENMTIDQVFSSCTFTRVHFDNILFDSPTIRRCEFNGCTLTDCYWISDDKPPIYDTVWIDPDKWMVDYWGEFTQSHTLYGSVSCSYDGGLLWFSEYDDFIEYSLFKEGKERCHRKPWYSRVLDRIRYKWEFRNVVECPVLYYGGFGAGRVYSSARRINKNVYHVWIDTQRLNPFDEDKEKCTNPHMVQSISFGDDIAYKNGMVKYCEEWGGRDDLLGINIDFDFNTNTHRYGSDYEPAIIVMPFIDENNGGDWTLFTTRRQHCDHGFDLVFVKDDI